MLDLDAPTDTGDSYRARFTNAYCETLIWANGTDENGESLDAGHWRTPAGDWALDAFGPDDQDTIRETCDDFLAAARDLLAASGQTPEQCGHDFLLTRSRHGAGFWDRGLGQVGNDLTRLSHPYGDTSCECSTDDTLITLTES